MAHIILTFLIVFGLFFFGINSIREMTGKEMWSLTKLLTYSVVCAILALATLISIVVIF